MMSVKIFSPKTIDLSTFLDYLRPTDKNSTPKYYSAFELFWSGIGGEYFDQGQHNNTLEESRKNLPWQILCAKDGVTAIIPLGVNSNLYNEKIILQRKKGTQIQSVTKKHPVDVFKAINTVRNKPGSREYLLKIKYLRKKNIRLQTTSEGDHGHAQIDGFWATFFNLNREQYAAKMDVKDGVDLIQSVWQTEFTKSIDFRDILNKKGAIIRENDYELLDMFMEQLPDFLENKLRSRYHKR